MKLQKQVMNSTKGNILITGISSGIGKDAAIALAERGYQIYGSVRKIIDADYVKSVKGKILPFVMDVSDSKSIETALLKLEGIAFTAVVNNAGIAVSGPLKYLDLEDFRRQFEVNVFGLLDVTQRVIPNLILNQQLHNAPGRIVNISSISGRVVTPFTGAYGSSKFAVEAISDALRRELFNQGIKVVIIEPGPIKTPIWDKAIIGKTDSFQNEYAPVLEYRADYARETERNALPVAEVTKKIIEAIESANPKTRYLIVKNRWIMKLILKGPDWLKDYFVMKRAKLK
jgi:short-subunit dehydrogenase